MKPEGSRGWMETVKPSIFGAASVRLSGLTPTYTPPSPPLSTAFWSSRVSFRRP